jgi:hypothetical protein
MTESISYALKKPISYTSKGQPVEAVSVDLFEPSAKHIQLCGILKQEFHKAAAYFQDKATDSTEQGSDDVDIGAEEVMGMMYGAATCDMNKVFVTAKELLTSGLALVDGEEKLTKVLYDKLDIEDAEGLIGSFLANFTLASLLRSVKAH